MRIPVRWMIALLLPGLAALPAAGWGSRGQTAVVTAAAHMMSKEDAIPLTNLMDSIRQGADATTETLVELIPGAAGDAVKAIASEMFLLQAVRGPRVDPYFAYRLGVLGKLVSQISAPMYTADPKYRTLYLADIEGRVPSVALKSAPRRNVDPDTYFVLVQREAAAHQDLIEKDYQSGLGFQGIASQSIAQDISRSLNAVADVWYTILQGQVRVVNVSQERTRSYYVSALDFYVRQRRSKEANTAYDRLMAFGTPAPELRKRIADMYYDAQQFERAIEEYRAVLEQAPGRRDVVERIAGYYTQLGDEAAKNDRLEAARDAYQKAVDVDKLSASAQEKLLDMQKQIADRDERQGDARQALDSAFSMEKQAEDLARGGDQSRAIELLDKAQQLYAGVGDEFPEERRSAQAGLNNIMKRKTQLRDELLRNTQNLSGAAASSDVQSLVKTQAKPLAEEALRALVTKEYEAELKRLTAEMQEKFATK